MHYQDDELSRTEYLCMAKGGRRGNTAAEIWTAPTHARPAMNWRGDAKCNYAGFSA